MGRSQTGAVDPGFTLHTCSYTEMQPDMGIAIRTSRGGPRWKLKYPIVDAIKEVMPEATWLKGVPRGEFRRLYFLKLDAIGADRLSERFTSLVTEHGDPRLVLLCFERLDKADEWCHRSMFAEWWTKTTGQPVTELGKGPAPAVRGPTLF